MDSEGSNADSWSHQILFLVGGWKHPDDPLLQFWLLSTSMRIYFMWSNKLSLFGGLSLTPENDMYLSREKKDFHMQSSLGSPPLIPVAHYPFRTFFFLTEFCQCNTHFSSYSGTPFHTLISFSGLPINTYLISVSATLLPKWKKAWLVL